MLNAIKVEASEGNLADGAVTATGFPRRELPPPMKAILEILAADVMEAFDSGFCELDLKLGFRQALRSEE